MLWVLQAQVHQLSSAHSVMSDSLRPHGLQHARPPCPSPTPRAYSNSCPWSRWCHPTIASSVIPFFSYLQSFPASGSFPVSQFFTAGGQNIGVSASASVLSMNIQDWPFTMDWLDLLAVQGTLKSLLQHYSSKASILRCSAFFIVQLSHPYMTAGKTISVCESKTSRYTIWIYKRQTNQRSNYQHLLDYRESKGVLEKHLLLLHWLC